MRFRISAIAAALICLASCVDVDMELGMGLVSDSHKYKMVTGLSIPLDVDMEYSDKLSGYSQYHMMVGSMYDESMGSIRRGCVLDLVPMADSLDFGTKPEVLRFHFSSALDSVIVSDPGQKTILQTLNVYQMKEPTSPKYDYTCTADVESRIDRSARIACGAPVLNGRDSMSFDFTKEYAEQYLSITKDDLKDIATYKKKIHGIYLEVPETTSGGRLNRYSLQLSYNADYYSVEGNFAMLDIRSTYAGERKDTTFLFYFSPSEIVSVDSLLTNSSSGALPQYCLNIVGVDRSRSDAYRGKGQAELHMQGGAGLKPHISAVWLKSAVEEKIREQGHDPSKVILSKATLVFPFEVKDGDYDRIGRDYPVQLSPNVKYPYKYTIEKESVWHVIHADLSDYSTASESKGNLDRTTYPMRYAPDITYHLQELLSVAPDDKALTDTSKYDIWLLAKRAQTITTVNSGSDEMSDYYSMLAYQSYYNSMYGGGSMYGDYYSNYYSYMLASMYAGNSSTSTSTSMVLDADGYYNAVLSGPAASGGADFIPRLEFSYAIPNSSVK